MVPLCLQTSLDFPRITELEDLRGEDKGSLVVRVDLFRLALTGQVRKVYPQHTGTDMVPRGLIMTVKVAADS